MKVLELFSGIGGMHLAAKEAESMLSSEGITLDVVTAIDINTSANGVYKFNFPHIKLLERNIQSISEQNFNKINPDIILMSPPCQPFTRTGLQKDLTDNRCCAFSYLLEIIPKIKSVRYILLENVKGFEVSQSRNLFIEMLKQNNFIYQDFLINSTEFGIPNSRTRYYLIARRIDDDAKDKELCFDHSDNVITSLRDIKFKPSRQTLFSRFQFKQFSLKNIIDTSDESSANYRDLLIPDKVLTKRFNVLDIVNQESSCTNCFTKAYSHYAEGTGSVFSNLKDMFKIKNIIDQCKQIQNKLQTSKDSSESSDHCKRNFKRKRKTIDINDVGIFNEDRNKETYLVQVNKVSQAKNIDVKKPNEDSNSEPNVPEVSDQIQLDEIFILLKKLNLRYFSPNEISKLMCFPIEGNKFRFNFPPNYTNRAKYKLLGNSINVHVVAYFISLMLS